MPTGKATWQLDQGSPVHPGNRSYSKATLGFFSITPINILHPPVISSPIINECDGSNAKSLIVIVNHIHNQQYRILNIVISSYFIPINPWCLGKCLICLTLRGIGLLPGATSPICRHRSSIDIAIQSTANLRQTIVSLSITDDTRGQFNVSLSATSQLLRAMQVVSTNRCIDNQPLYSMSVSLSLMSGNHDCQVLTFLKRQI